MSLKKMKNMMNNILSTILLRSLVVIALSVGSLLAVSIAEAASLSLSPGTGVYAAGQAFTVNVSVNTNGTSINAAEGTLNFNANELSVVSIQKGTIFNLWTAEPTFSNAAGTISFSGGSPTGYSGSNGVILRVTFRPKGSGASKVSYKSGSVLAADGRGTNVLQGMNGGSYTITSVSEQPEPEVIEYVASANTPAAPVIRSDTHSDPNGWYQATTAELSWSVPAGVTGLRTLLNDSPSSVPTKVYDTPIDSLSLDLEEGIQYLHVQFRNSEGWGKVSHYRLAVDTIKPESFKMSFPDGADLSSPEQVINLSVKDETSPVTRFLVQLDGAEPYEHVVSTGSSTLPLAGLSPGHHTLIVEAFDAAGNSIISTFSFGILAFDRPQFTDYPTQLNEGVIPVIKGITRPGAEVTITISSGSQADPITARITADQNGVFTFIPELTFTSGVYRLQAVATDQYGAQSEPSEEITIAVQRPGYIVIGTLLVSILSVFVPLLAILVLLVLGLMYLWRRMVRVRQGVNRETKEALQVVASEFTTLHQVLNDAEEELVGSRKNKRLTKAETQVLQVINDALVQSQKRIYKEVDDVDDQVQ